ncbi:MAG: FAD-binding oxidoreductase [Phycisphaerae bacterium]|nr:FAD-binding oxidoreductase [Gemmatimonadaceae bacterium]
MIATTADSDVRRAYARDVSGLELTPEFVSRPASAAETVELLKEAHDARVPVTTAGAQSSTTGASITDSGILLSLRGLAGGIVINPETRTARVDAGVIVGDVRRAAAEHGLLFTPDPTSEEESTVGGAVACNASGARSLRYGATRPHVRALTVALADGTVHEFRRSQLEKNTVGFAIAHEPVDWFVGSEGTLGVVLSAEFGLLPLPLQSIGLAIPFPNEANALAFVADARRSRKLNARCLEYFDNLALGIAREREGSNAPGTLGSCMVYAEETGSDTDPESELPLDAWLELAEAHHADTGDIRVYDSEPALLAARRLRHAVPSTMNERGSRFIAAGGRKVSTDWAVPFTLLAQTLDKARQHADAAGIEQAVAYGHAGNGHPHQNFVARDADELRRIEKVVEATLLDVLAVGGTVAAEHGIGKLKRKWLPLQMSPVQQRAMRALKCELDPLGLLAPGNVL